MSTQPVSDVPVNARQRLLDGALKLFSSKGYAATSVRELVEAAGVTKPVLYYYFTSKEGLYLALMQDALADFHQVAEQALTIPGSAQARIKGYCSAIRAVFAQRLEVARLIYAIYYGPPQGAPPIDFEASFSTMLVHMEQLISEGVGSGEFREVMVQDAAWAVVSLLNMALEELLCRGEQARINEQGLQRMLALLIEGIKK